MNKEENNENGKWSWLQNKAFEIGLALIPENEDMRWEKVASFVCGKSPMEVIEHYQTLHNDVAKIEQGLVNLPNYPNDSDDILSKGTPWTEDEQRSFLDGLKKYGKGDWKSISRQCVVTRTPSQVASHAQKYYKRQNVSLKERKRKSIHDVTLPDQDLVTDDHNVNQQRNMYHQMDRSKYFRNDDSNNNKSDGSENESNSKNSRT